MRTSLPRPLDRGYRRYLLGIGGIAVLILLLVAARYGYHRDELYFLAATDHLAWGYVDQPPLTIWIAWLADAIAPGSLFALRVIPALAIGAVVALSGVVTNHLGGGRLAVRLAPVAVAAAGIFFGVGHLLSTTTFDILFWSVLLYLTVRLLSGADERLWLVFGVVAGVGLLNKHLVLFLLFGLFVGLVATSHRRLLRSRWLWLGGIVALVIWAPNLLWQVSNDWPTLEMLGSLQDDNSGIGKAIEFVALQIPFLSLAVLPLAVLGFRRTMRSEAQQFRPIGIGFIALVVLFLAVGGKAYYIVPFYVVFVPMGMVEMEERWDAGSARFTPRRMMVTIIGAGLLMAPFFLPIVPETSVGFFNAVNSELGETIGWDQMVGQVAGVYHALPDDQQESVTIFTGSYGEAGAIDRYGPALGLPAAQSGHNAYSMWGPPPDTAIPVIFVGYGPQWLDRLCGSWELASTIENSAGIDNEEQGLPIAVCGSLRTPWSSIWSDLRHYN